MDYDLYQYDPSTDRPGTTEWIGSYRTLEAAKRAAEKLEGPWYIHNGAVVARGGLK